MIGDAGVRLVPLQPAHRARTLAWTNDPALARLMNRTGTVSVEEHAAWFDAVLGRADCAFFALERLADGAHVGNVWLWGIDSRHRKAELRVVVGDATAQNQGLGSRAIDCLCTYAFSVLSLHRIYAFVLDINPRGRRAFEKAGFSSEGTLRDDRWIGDRFVDVHLLARLAPGARS